MEKIAIRDAYGDALKELGNRNDRIVALEADVGGSTKSKIFGDAFPNRYYQVGISELNMVAMAAGMASAGLVPFVNTFSAFLATRGGDVIQSLIAYDKLNVKLAGTYVGMSDSYDGASHHAITDVAFLRAIPGMVVITPSDAVMTKKAVLAAAEYEGPVYLRLSRAPAPVMYNEDEIFEIGKGIKCRDGKDVTLISTGTLLSKVVEAAELLEKEGVRAEVIDMQTLKPFDAKLVIQSARKTGAVVTVEENSIWGGLFSAVSEALIGTYPIPVVGIGLNDFAESGDYEQLLTKYGFSAQNIVSKVREII